MIRFIGIITLNLIFTLTLKSQIVSEKWLTLFEKSDYQETPDYDATVNYLKNIADYNEYAELKSMGISPQGREIYYLVVSKDKMFNAGEVRNSEKPVLLVLNGIHSGEINGKDASLLLLREILVTKEKENYLDNSVLLVVPIFNVDGHERRGAYNRINQIGPKETGWRTTAQNLNLNRDFMKADAPEMQHFLKLYNDWLPDFFIDVHSTDGADFQYHTTFALEKHENVTPKMGEWVKDKFNSYLIKTVESKGFLISPFVGFVDGDLQNGIYDWIPLPRFSNGFAAVHNRPGLLIESHILKTYKERVYSTKAIIESVLEYINAYPGKLIELVEEADEYILEKYYENKEPYPLHFERSARHDSIIYKGIKAQKVSSSIAGDKVKMFSGEPIEIKVPYFNDGATKTSVTLPEYYIVPKEWQVVIDRLYIHGIKMWPLEEDTRYIVQRYKFYNTNFPEFPYEGRFLPDYNYTEFIDTVAANAGDYIIPTNQRALGILAHLLEPKGEDSFVKWGFFNIIFERKEYFEDYAMEPIAQQMYDENIKLKREFDAKLRSDKEFAANPRERLNFFYKNSPYYDQHHNVYPVMRIIEEYND